MTTTRRQKLILHTTMSITVAIFILLGLTHFPISVALMIILLSPFISLFLYSSLHEFFHSQKLMPSSLWKFGGVLLSAPIGFSWQVYSKHHANHHKFNNGDGDYAKTTTAEGLPKHGAKYLLKHAMIPFVLQLIPFLTVAGMKAKNRSFLTWIDELCRIAFRLFPFLVGGFSSGMLVLTFQLGAIATIMYLNYMQHFCCKVGHGADWITHNSFDLIFPGINNHTDHHANPSRDGWEIRPSGGVSLILPIFHPRTVLAFLWAPASLHKILTNHFDMTGME